tara:strand:- start:711 stop:944 length:234 start_codon:yes stop_codon:yes gene_type:complete
MDNINDLIQELRKNAENELEFCNQGETPNVCNLSRTERGKKLIVDLIVEYVGKRSMTISEAIITIERENNVQLSEVM